MATVSKKRKGSASPLQRGLWVAGGCVLVGGLVYLMSGKSDGGKRRAPAPQVVNITVPPPPPPPPPPRPKPPETTPPPEAAQQMVAETAAEPTPAPSAPSNDGPLGTGIKGDGGADGFGLGTGPGGGGGTGTRLSASGGGTRWAGFTNTVVKKRIYDAILTDPRTRAADGHAELGVYLDAGGRITRVVVRKSTYKAEEEAALKGDLLVGMQLQPPPADMPQPIWLRTTLRRPN